MNDSRYPTPTAKLGDMRASHETNAQREAAVLGLGTTKLQKLLADRGLPKPIRLGASLHWRVREVVDWLAAGCPDRVRWTWTPSTLMVTAERCRLLRIELRQLEADVERLKQERAQLCAGKVLDHG